MRTLALLTALAALAACGVPSQNDPITYGTVRVALGPGLDGTPWRDDQARELVAELAALAALGPAWQLTSEGAADVVVRPAALAGGACGRYVAGAAFVEVDPACTAGYLALRRAAGHELTHWLTWTRWRWLGHLCSWPYNAPVPAGCHPLIVCRDCLMSPGLAPADDMGPTWSEAYTGPVIDPAPAWQDLELIRGCVARGRCE